MLRYIGGTCLVKVGRSCLQHTVHGWTVLWDITLPEVLDGCHFLNIVGETKLDLRLKEQFRLSEHWF